MKNIKHFNSKTFFFALVFITLLGCERELSDAAEFATFAKTGDIFIDAPIGLGTDFYFPFLGSKPTAFSVDNNEGYQSAASIRIDVPNADDPEGNYAGAIFRVDGAGRDLTDFDALTFWAKASQGVSIGEIGFGQDFGENKFQVTRIGVSLGTNWAKYTIPIPDPSKLTNERGMLWFSAGGIGPEGQEVGYTFWLDEVKFEKLGNIAQPQPAILNGQDETEVGFNGGSNTINGFSQTFNLGSGINQTVLITPSYFTFSSSDIEVARANELGVVSVVGSGSAKITAILGGVKAKGSLTVESLGNFTNAPTPSNNAGDVISIFSDAYNDVSASLISDFGEFQNSTLSAFEIDNNNVLNYQNVNFFGIEFNSNVPLPTIDASEMTTLHFDIFIPNTIGQGASLNINLRNVGPNGMIETDPFTGAPTGDDTEIGTVPTLVSGQWISVDFDITSLADRSALGQIVFVAPEAGPSNFYVDNIYFYK